MSKKHDYIFICSSLIDISEILYQIEKLKTKNYFIVVTTSRYSYDFLCKIIDKHNIVFLNSTLNSKPKNIFLWIKELLVMVYLKFLFRNSNIKKVFFYTPVYDLIAFYMVVNVFKNSEIILSNSAYNEGMNVYKKVPKKSILHSLYSKLYRIPIHSYSNYRLKIFGGGYIAGLPNDLINKFTLEKENSIKEIQDLIKSKYLIQYDNSKIDDKSILLDQGKSDFNGILDFDDVFKKVLNIFDIKTVTVKGYYDNRTSPFKNYGLDRLDLDWPIEYYNLNGCKNIFCVFTSAIGRIPKGKYRKISLLNLFKFENEDEKENWKLFMDKIGDDILYPNSFDELESIINNQDEI